MMEQAVLSDLCMLCFAEKPKYRCPRCMTQTCSLPCYRRHQQRASCSGKRDPAAFLKKSQWATPAGIDQDYNYLRGIERTIDDATQHVHGHENGSDAPISKGAAHGRHPDSSLQKYLIKNRITVDHAPKGMSRQKTNLTRVSKSRNVLWTVEWSDASGNREIRNDCLESNSVAETYAVLQAEKRNLAKRKLEFENQHEYKRVTKRKRALNVSELHHDEDHGDRRREVEFIQRLKDEEPDGKDYLKPEALDNAGLPAMIVAGEHDRGSPKTGSVAIHTVEGEANSGSTDSCKEESQKTSVGLDSNGCSSSVHFKLDVAESDEVRKLSDRSPLPKALLGLETLHTHAQPRQRHYYYLLKPSTSGISPVLIPLNSASSLTDCLQDQVVQEYPTIYVLPDSQESLPPGFVLDKDYVSPHIGDRGSQSAKSTDGDRYAANMEKAGQQKDDQKATELNAKSILDMLKRDITI